FNKNQRKLVRAGSSLVALKMLFNSNNAIQEIQSAVINNHFNSSVYDLIRNGNIFYRYLCDHLLDLTIGLQPLHGRQYIHRNLHSGSILCGLHLLITDFGRCRKTTEIMDDEVFGIIPY
ncbi:2572_t:CDS:2, partial [Ambispora leptoticha]